jgi:hypothetical protein
MIDKPDGDNGPEPKGKGTVTQQAAAHGRKLKQLFDRISPLILAVAAALSFVISLLLQFLTGNSRIVSAVVSLTLVTVCLLIFKLGPFLRSEFARSIRAMWMPIAVTIVAGALLFYEGQGRDLGVGLLGEGQFKLIMLCLILIYWALNNWHSARVGLNHEFAAELSRAADASPTNGTSEDPAGMVTGRWLFWPPRLLGVCAHLFAALSLALASLNVVTASGGSSSALTLSNLLVFTAPLTIGLVTIAVWAYDVAFISENRKKPMDPGRARWIVGLSVALAAALLIGLSSIENRQLVPEGLFWVTFWISLSAVIFLYFVSRARKHFTATPLNHDRLTVVLALPAIIAVIVVCLVPTFVGEWLGSLNVFFFAFGAVLAVINGIGWFGKFIVNMQERAERFKFAGQCAAFLLLLAALTSLMRDFHRVRLCATEPCTPVPAQGQAWSPIPSVDDRPTVRDAALAWYKQAEKLYHKDDATKQKPVPMLIIATAGGGIRAAYWTATVLERLHNDLGKKGQALDKLLFAVSGVSGGSVGATDYIAALHAGDKPTSYLQSDFLAPAIASLVFADAPSNFLPDFGQVDRGTALEQSLENGSKGYLGYSFLSFFPNTSDLSENWRPALLLNATHQETGRRVIASNLKVEKDTFLDSFDELELLDSDMRASTVAHNSARFTYVSPAGKLVPRIGPDLKAKIDNRGYVIDGGYFENYGALTALELARSAREEIKREGGSVKLVILQISSDPTLTKERTRVRTIEEGDNCFLTTVNAPASLNGKDNYLSFADAGRDPVTHRWHKNDGEGWVVSYLNELAAPLIGVTAVREAHGTLAAAELASAVCVERDTIKAASQSGEKLQPAAISDPLVAKAGSTSGMPGQMRSVASATTTPRETPHFAHLAMCEVSENNKAPIVPPLGWVLSKPMRERFPAIFDDCGNQAELTGLETALE